MSNDDDCPRAVVREIDGQLVLDDPAGLAMIRAVEKHNLRGVLEAHAERVAYFRERAKSFDDLRVVIVLVAVDDPVGGVLAEELMPDVDWDAYRARGEIPYARGLAGRIGIEEALDQFDGLAAQKLRSTPGVPVVVVDRGVAEIFP